MDTLSTNLQSTVLKADCLLSELKLRKTYRGVLKCQGHDRELACFGDMIDCLFTS